MSKPTWGTEFQPTCDHRKTDELARSTIQEGDRLSVLLHLQCVRCLKMFGRDVWPTKNMGSES